MGVKPKEKGRSSKGDSKLWHYGTTHLDYRMNVQMTSPRIAIRPQIEMCERNSRTGTSEDKRSGGRREAKVIK